MTSRPTLLSNRQFRFLLVGQTASMFGDMAMFLVLSIWVRDLTGSKTAAGLTFLFFNVPYLFAPLGGYLVDRVARRRLMIVVDLVSALIVLPLAFVGTDKRAVALIYAVAFAFGVSQMIFQSARSAYISEIIPSELLASANGVLTTVRQVLRLLAPLAGVGIYAGWGGATVSMIDSFTFVVSAVAMMCVRGASTRPPRDEKAGSWRTEIAAGVVHLMRSPHLRGMLIALCSSMLVLGFSEALIFYIIQDGLHQPARFLAWTNTVQGVGAVIAGWLSARMVGRFGEGRTVAFALGCAATAAALFTGTGFAIIMPALFLLGLAMPFAYVGFMTALQRWTPDHLQGRAFSASDLMLSLPQSLSVAAAGAAVGWVDYRILLVLMAVVLATAAVYLLGASRGPGLAEEPTAEPDARSDAMPSREVVTIHGGDSAADAQATSRPSHPSTSTGTGDDSRP